MSEELSAVLDELGRRFGATGAELWAELVRYEVVGALAVAGGFLVAAAGLTIFAWRLWEKHRNGGNYNDWDVPAGIATAFAGFAWIGVVISVAGAIVTLAAPQAAVIRGLLP